MDPREQRSRAEAFSALHEGPGAFVIPNPWDSGTARLLAGLGFAALATTSAGLAFALGRRDGANLVDRARTLANAGAIVAATRLPVSADLESGFGQTPQQVAETILLAAEVGLVGGSIEDATGRQEDPIYRLDEAVARIAAAARAARGLPFPFTLTARCENFLYGRPDLDDTIQRLRAYERAGADVVYAPGLPDIAAIRAVCAAVETPVNVLAGGAPPQYTVAELAAAGVRRVSLGSALPRMALAAVLSAAREIRDGGTFTFAADALPYPQANALVSDSGN